MTTTTSLVLLQQLIGNGVTRTARRTCTGSGNPRVTDDIANLSTDKHVTMAIDKSEMTMLAIFSDHEITMTAVGAADAEVSEELTIDTDSPYIWHSENGEDNPFSDDVLYWKVTNASGATASLVIECLQDATP